MNEPLGYIILTSQPDGAWQPDWDGVMHTDRAAAVCELALASRALGSEVVQLASVGEVVLTPGWATDAQRDSLHPEKEGQ